jgi:hypothetical protein
MDYFRIADDTSRMVGIHTACPLEWPATQQLSGTNGSCIQEVKHSSEEVGHLPMLEAETG